MNRQQLFLVQENNHDQGETVTWRSIFTNKQAAYAAMVQEAKDLEELYEAESNLDNDTLTVSLLADGDVLVDWEILDAELVA